MGSQLSIQAEIKPEHFKQIRKIANNGFGLRIQEFYRWEDGSGLIIWHTKYFGYAEPDYLYALIKDMVEDIHVIDIGCATTMDDMGEDVRINVTSCKKNWEEISVNSQELMVREAKEYYPYE